MYFTATSTSGCQYVLRRYRWAGDVCLAMGRLDDALDYFERAIDERNAILLRMGTSPEYDALRGHPRFNELLRRVNLPVG